jgi:hypothetical protein
MDRHVIPSMILSVLIVCFFSVLLYERDKPAALARDSIGKTPPVASPAPAPAKLDASAASSATAPKTSEKLTAVSPSKTVDQGPHQEAKGLLQPGVRSASTADAGASSSAAASSEKTVPARAAEAPASPGAPASQGPALAPKKDAASSADPVSRPKEKPASQAAGSSPASTGPRSAFTTVKDGETLEDVTVRIYGSSDQLDLLWRANRDLLPRKNSPLSAGAVLRTPGE